jgi:hypothetical protein
MNATALNNVFAARQSLAQVLDEVGHFANTQNIITNHILNEQ